MSECYLVLGSNLNKVFSCNQYAEEELFLINETGIHKFETNTKSPEQENEL